MAELKRSEAIQGEIWAVPSRVSRPVRGPVRVHPAAALAQRDDRHHDHGLMATRMHPPPVVFGLLAAMALASALLAGYGMAGRKPRSWTHAVGFAAVIAVTVYIVVDIEYPRMGLIRVDAADRLLADLRESMRTAGP